MILRIVQLPITPGTPEGNDFEQLFDAFKEKIAAAPGCYSLQLLKAQQCYFTYSRWEKESWLEAYRNSPLF
jgi:heme-degrading monooxygenase HmoA